MNGDAHFTEVFLDDALVADADRIGAVGEGWRVALHRARVRARRVDGRQRQRAARRRPARRAGPPARRCTPTRSSAHGSPPRRTTRGGRAGPAPRAAATAAQRESPGPQGRHEAARQRRPHAATTPALGGSGCAVAEHRRRPHGEWQTLFLTAPSLSIRGGTDEIQRNIVGERVLGLPPEPRADVDVPFAELPRTARRAEQSSALDPAAVLHELTQHGSPTDQSLLVDFQPLDPSNRPAPFKRYVGLETTPLPTDFGDSGTRAADVLSGRDRPAAAAGLDAATLARLLFFTAGVTRTSASPVFEEPTYFRTAMSAGNLHPVEVSTGCPRASTAFPTVCTTSPRSRSA